MDLCSAPGGRPQNPGSVLGALKPVLQALLEPIHIILDRPWKAPKASLSDLGRQKAAQKAAKTLPNGGQEATQATDGETLIFADRTLDFDDF